MCEMGQEMTTFCVETDQKNEKLLQKALKKNYQLDHDIRLARHNKIVNSQGLLLSAGSPHEHQQKKVNLKVNGNAHLVKK